MGRIVGIDLGTTNSVVATVDMRGSQILPNRENEQQTRSIVGFHKDEFLVGSPALRRWPLAPKDTIISIKRLMGRAINDLGVELVKKGALYEIIKPSGGTKDSVCIKLNGQEYTPIEISSKILTKLKNDAEFVLGEEVTHAVITVPAYFSEKQRNATREAGLKAGLTVMKILDEPTAAAVAFGIDAKEQEAKTILVFDLGGGTFDISILMMAAGSFAHLNLEGDMWLGGDNFDQVIVDYVVRQIKREHGIDPEKNLRFMATLKEEAQKVKETLSSARIEELIVTGMLQNGAGDSIDIEMEITREEFEKMIKPLIERIVSLVKKAVENANFTIDDIDYVLMAGNAASVPKVQQAMEQLFRKEKILRKIHPKHSVAIGAAITGAIFGAVKCPECDHNNSLESKVCEKCGKPLISSPEKKKCPICETENDKDAERCENEECGSPFIEIGIGGIAPFHYGIQTAGDKFHIFINKNDQYETPVDKRQFQTFHTRIPGQRTTSIPVFGGNNSEKASKNEKQGEAFAILPPNCPEGTAVRIKLWLNNDGNFELSAQLDDGTDLQPDILRGDERQKLKETLEEAEVIIEQKERAGILSQDEIEKMKGLRDKAYEQMKKDEIEDANKTATELLENAKKGKEEGDPLRTKAEGIIGFTTFIINKYSWLLGQSVYRLNNSLGKLKSALDRNDENLMKDTMKELEMELNKHLTVSDPRRIPLLVIFLGMNKAINSRIQPADPALANALRGELDEVESAYKENRPLKEKLLGSFDKKLQDAIKKFASPEGSKCPKCGHINPSGAYRCEKCGELLTLLGE